MMTLQLERLLRSRLKPRHPFVVEVARIAEHLNIKQGELARRYTAIAGGNIESANVARHLTTKRRPSKQVVETYSRMLGMSKHYVSLLMDPDALVEKKSKRLILEEPVGRYLRPEWVEPLFEVGAISEAIDVMRCDKKLLDTCLYEAELAGERFCIMPGSRWIPTLPVEPDVIRASGADEKYVVKWAAVAKVLLGRQNIDLASRIRQKDARRIRREELLSTIWENLYCALIAFDSQEYRAGEVDFAPLDWDEWLALEHVLTLVFNRRKWPVKKMLERLHSNIIWSDFAEAEDPERRAFLMEQGQEALEGSHAK
ncbi:MAG: hypothetical protein WB615_01100 [Candidatus Tumulicola sp.]